MSASSWRFKSSQPQSSLVAPSAPGEFSVSELRFIRGRLSTPMRVQQYLDAIPYNLENFRGNPTNTGIFWNVHEWRLR